MKRVNKLGRRQQGLSSLGWIAVAGFFGLIIITFFKVYPFYYDNFKVKTALEAIQNDSAIDPKSKRAIWDSLQKRLFINDVKAIKRENVTMARKDGQTTVTVTYKVEDDYILNLYIGGKFEESIVIDR
jgi:hypothetical protein